MAFEKIDSDKLILPVHDVWGAQWLLLTSGDFNSKKMNTMTVGWGSFGTMWNRPFAQVVVRHSRYTFEFMEKYDTFTLCTFQEKYKKALQLLGTKSGRNGDKIAEAGLTPMSSEIIDAPGFKEADLIFECEKTYWSDMEPDHFLNPAIMKQYPNKDFHRIYFGEVKHIRRSARKGAVL